MIAQPRTVISWHRTRIRDHWTRVSRDSHGPSDARNCAGFAIAEIGLGTLAGASFTDDVRHTADGSEQTVTYVSSVDAWHGPSNQVMDEEQPGLDRVLTSGLTRDLPGTVPVAMAYGTPEDAAAEIAYLESQGYPLGLIELGEEAERAVHEPGGLRCPLCTVGHCIARG